MKYTFTIEIWQKEKPGQPVSTAYETFSGIFPDDATAIASVENYANPLELEHIKGKEDTDHKYVAFVQRTFDRKEE